MIRNPFRGLIARLTMIIAVVGLAGVVARGAYAREIDSTWTAPPDAAARPNPLANRSEVAAGGRKLFEQRCASCHGHEAQGTGKGPDLTASGVQAQGDGAIFWKITQGNTRVGMPTFSFLPEPQRWQLVMHLRTLRSPVQ
jgi:mono/diheme cytochrome c family protein